MALLLSSAVSCSLPRTMPELAGTYVMHKDYAADTLVLRADGRYVRWYRKGDIAAVVDSGAWVLSNHATAVALRDYKKRWRFVHDCMYSLECKELTQPATLALTIERSRWGTFRLGWHSGFGWWYSRIAKPS